MKNKKEICHDLAIEYAKIAILNPNKLSKDEYFQPIPGLGKNLRRDFAQYYFCAFEWYEENFSTYIGSKVLSDTED